MTIKQYPYNVVDLVFGEECCPCDEDRTIKLKERIEKLIAPLPKERQRIFFLYAREGASIGRIAENENLSWDEVYDRICLTLRYLRHPIQSKQLADFYEGS